MVRLKNLESSINFEHETFKRNHLTTTCCPSTHTQTHTLTEVGSRAEVLGGQTRRRLPLDGVRGHRSAAADDALLREARVLTLPVAPQIHLPLERLLAETAAEGLVAGVFAHVRDQVRRLAERFAADDALVRLLA